MHNRRNTYPIISKQKEKLKNREHRRNKEEENRERGIYWEHKEYRTKGIQIISYQSRRKYRSTGTKREKRKKHIISYREQKESRRTGTKREIKKKKSEREEPQA
jgi:hypothetical protein